MQIIYVLDLIPFLLLISWNVQTLRKKLLSNLLFFCMIRLRFTLTEKRLNIIHYSWSFIPVIASEGCPHPLEVRDIIPKGERGVCRSGETLLYLLHSSDLEQNTCCRQCKIRPELFRLARVQDLGAIVFYKDRIIVESY